MLVVAQELVIYLDFPAFALEVQLDPVAAGRVVDRHPLRVLGVDLVPQLLLRVHVHNQRVLDQLKATGDPPTHPRLDSLQAYAVLHALFDLPQFVVRLLHFPSFLLLFLFLFLQLTLLELFLGLITLHSGENEHILRVSLRSLIVQQRGIGGRVK